MRDDGPDASVGGTLNYDDFRSTAAAFSQLSGVLGGFCITILVLVLDQGFLADHGGAKEVAIVLLLITGVLYTASSGLQANSMNSLDFMLYPNGTKRTPKKLEEAQVRMFRGGMTMFLGSNILLAIDLAIILFYHSTGIAFAVMAVILLAAVGFALSHVYFTRGRKPPDKRTTNGFG